MKRDPIPLILRHFACRNEFGVAPCSGWPCSEIEVPEGRHNVAHRETVGALNGDVWSPGGGRHTSELEHVSPLRGFPSLDSLILPFHGGLRSVVPNGTGCESKGNSSCSLKPLLSRLCRAMF